MHQTDSTPTLYMATAYDSFFPAIFKSWHKTSRRMSLLCSCLIRIGHQSFSGWGWCSSRASSRWRSMRVRWLSLASCRIGASRRRLLISLHIRSSWLTQRRSLSCKIQGGFSLFQSFWGKMRPTRPWKWQIYLTCCRSKTWVICNQSKTEADQDPMT